MPSFVSRIQGNIIGTAAGGALGGVLGGPAGMMTGAGIGAGFGLLGGAKPLFAVGMAASVGAVATRGMGAAMGDQPWDMRGTEEKMMAAKVGIESLGSSTIWGSIAGGAAAAGTMGLGSRVMKSMGKTPSWSKLGKWGAVAGLAVGAATTVGKMIQTGQTYYDSVPKVRPTNEAPFRSYGTVNKLKALDSQIARLGRPIRGSGW